MLRSRGPYCTGASKFRLNDTVFINDIASAFVIPTLRSVCSLEVIAETMTSRSFGCWVREITPDSLPAADWTDEPYSFAR